MTDTETNQLRTIAAQLAALDGEIAELTAEAASALPALEELLVEIADDPDRGAFRDELLLLLVPARLMVFCRKRDEFSALLKRLPLHELN